MAESTNTPGGGALRGASDEGLAALLDSVPAIVFVLDAQGIVRFAAGRGLEAAGLGGGSALGRAAVDLYPQEPFRSALQRALAGEPVTAIGSVGGRWCEVRCAQHLLAGQVADVVGVALDVTDHVRAEEAARDDAHRLQELAESSRAAVAARDEFLSVASHELRTPLAALKLAVQNLRAVLMGQVPASLETVQHAVETAERQQLRLEGLVSTLLDVSRARMGQLELDLEEVELTPIVQEAVAHFEPEAPGGIALRVEGQPTGRCDRFRIVQVVENLLSNAVKYGAGRRIEVVLAQEGPLMRLSVTDHGIGIPEEAQRQIFDRFERAVSSRDYAGLGLGLYIARRIVEAHGGTLRVASAIGQGSTFTVELPSAGPPREAGDAAHGGAVH